MNKCRPWAIFKRLPLPYEQWAKEPDGRELAPMWCPRKGPPLRLSEMLNGHLANAHTMCLRNPEKWGPMLPAFDAERARRWPNVTSPRVYMDPRKTPVVQRIEYWTKEKPADEPKRSWWSRLWRTR